ncbi:MAG: YceI family protein [Oligoflexia bacterium]|nr:YceI family protein [Oligoflexia bacterium]
MADFVMKHSKSCLRAYAVLSTLICAAIYPSSTFASDKTLWNLPKVLSDENTKVVFSVDTTWHTVHGKTGGIAGRAWLQDNKDPSSVKAEVKLPVRLFNTDSESRDKRLREVMAESAFPEVVLRIDSLDGKCIPEKVALEACQGVISGSLAIHGLIREVRLPYAIRRDGETYKVSGDFTFEWAAFDVEDPSILIAHVDKNVAVHYELSL